MQFQKVTTQKLCMMASIGIVMQTQRITRKVTDLIKFFVKLCNCFFLMLLHKEYQCLEVRRRKLHRQRQIICRVFFVKKLFIEYKKILGNASLPSIYFFVAECFFSTLDEQLIYRMFFTLNKKLLYRVSFSLYQTESLFTEGFFRHQTKIVFKSIFLKQ